MFTHLHTHSHYSLLDGLPKIDDLVAKAKEYKMDSLALTDHGVMYGVIEFYQKCVEAGIKPIIGIEAYMAPNSRHDKQGKFDKDYNHLILLAENNTGYQNLLKLTTQAHLEGFYYKPRVDWELLEKYHEGIIAMTACLGGAVPKAILNNENVEEVIDKHIKVFGRDNFFLELQHHPEEEKQQKVNNKLIELSKKMMVPLVCTNDVHYLNPEDAEAQDILLCLQMKKKQTDTDRMTMLDHDLSFTSPEKMADNFKDWPEALENTQKIADRCNVNIELNKTLLPNFEVPNNKSADEYLKELCIANLDKRYNGGITEEITKRLDYELEVITKTGFASYFLIVQDFVNWAKDKNIIVGPGRGSAAGSIVSYLLNITNIDPIKFELIFERFLNPERISMPDIDLDFADTRRDEVINYVAEKYGHDHVAQIITFGTMAARAAIRDVGRVLAMPYTYCDKMAKMVPMFSTLSEALESVDEFKEIYNSDPEAKNLIEYAKKLEGVARHASTHACGVLITPKPLDQFVPLQYSTSDNESIISQYSLHPVEDLGLLKMDFLGLKNLSSIETTLEVIAKTTGEVIDMNKIPLDDDKTFKLFKKGHTIGVFQLESSGMRRYLVSLDPSIIEDIIVMISLYRPGPMEFIPDYIARKKGLKTITYLHPKLKPILEKTYGIAVYQEQVMRIARELANFSYSEADVLRKAVGKKIKKLLDEQEGKMIEGMINNGVNKNTAQQIWEYILPFARYGFNRAHAASYAMISYQTAYLKANYPTQFMAAILTSDLGNTDRIALEIAEAEKMGIEVMPPDINESFTIFSMVVSEETKDKPRIRFGLGAIKNVGAHITKIIIHERKENGPFKDLTDFLTRVQDKDLNKKSLESLIKSGSLDEFGERNELLLNSDKLLKFSKRQDTSNGQSDLFSSSGIDTNFTLKLDSVEEATKQQRLTWEKELLGIYLSEHPLDEVKHLLPQDITFISKLNELSNNFEVKVAGVIQKIKKVITRKGDPMMFVTLEDATGTVEVLIFPKILEKTRNLWQEDKLVMLTGKISEKDSEPKILCDSVSDLMIEDIKNMTLNLTIPRDTDKEIIDELKKVLEQEKGNMPVYLNLFVGQNLKKVKLTQGITYTTETKNKLINLLSIDNIRLS
ncbi:DNA polymerase III subunit alpha [bacterium]|jgi:DNA polymerase III subunit alpha|nr:DNA polymerase III subunit alpha [bacterium]MBT4335488.1 DNA polymerase III subunit alpha [bacterium]MBT4495483.1 DNA polymerase III subunit alpha [bacterium]MBT4764330.1 DNA polymerase III subunit alpha [bacterium]MBT5401701.1 DNA polymerase III subunit alpha [bacterium]